MSNSFTCFRTHILPWMYLDELHYIAEQTRIANQIKLYDIQQCEATLPICPPDRQIDTDQPDGLERLHRQPKNQPKTRP